MVIADFTGNFLNVDTCSEGDTCEMMNEGAYTPKEYEGRKSESLDMPVKNLRTGKELIYTPKMSEGKKLVNAFGGDTALWVGKKFITHRVRIKSFGQTKEVIEIEPIVVKTEKVL